MDERWTIQEGETGLEHYRRAISSFDSRYKSVLPSDVSPARFLELAISAVTRKPKLLECTLQSVCQSLYFCATLGLLPDSPMGHIFVVPFYSTKMQRFEAQMMMGFKGYAHLAYLSSLVGRIDAYAVRAKDEFDWEYGSAEFVRHKPFDGADAGELTHAWAQVFFSQAHIPPRFLVMQQHQILEIKANSPGAKFRNTPWFDDRFEAEMWKKTPVRALAKLLPQSDGDKLTMAANYEEQMETHQKVNPNDFGWPDDIQGEKPKEREKTTSRVMKGFPAGAQETTAEVVETEVGPTTADVLKFMVEQHSDLPPDILTKYSAERLDSYDGAGRQRILEELEAQAQKDQGVEEVEQPTTDAEAGQAESTPPTE